MQNNRQKVFEKYNGNCAYCGCELQKGWHIDHLKPIKRYYDGTCENPELDVFENYMPSCPSCNIQKNSYSLEQFRSNIKQFVVSLNKYNTQYKFAKRYGLIKEAVIEIKFYFEKINEKKQHKIKDFTLMAGKLRNAGNISLAETYERKINELKLK